MKKLELSGVGVETVSQGLLVRSDVSVEEGTYDVIMTPEDQPSRRGMITITTDAPEPAAFAPPWDDAPEWAEWAVRDKKGAGQWFEMRPNPAGSPWWMAVGQRQAFGNWREATRDPNWRDTLQKRPKPEPAEPPSWDDAPDWAKWWARDECGSAHWFDTHPHIASRSMPAPGFWDHPGPLGRRYGYWPAVEGTPDPNWCTTLQGRPKPPEPELNPCPRCGGTMRVKDGGPHSWWLVCNQCDNESLWCDTRAEAIAAHNARKSPELDPCPHCSGEWEYEEDSLYTTYPHRARCTGCNHHTRYYTTIYELAADVNRRPA